MTKQIRLTSDLLNSSPLYKMSVGFDRLFDEMFTNTGALSTTGYPPYNVARVADKQENVTYEITLAVAGFTQEDIEITVEDNHLKIEGRSAVLAEEVDTTVEYIHKGIAERNFQRSFRLAEHVEVSNAALKDGILKIVLQQNVPEEAKPKKIAIS